MEKKITLISPYVFPGLRETEDKFLTNVMFERNKNKRISKQEIIKVIAEEFGVNIMDIESRSRKKEIVNARYVYFATLKIKFDFSLTEIGKHTSNRDHTTVIHGLSTFRDRFGTEDAYRKIVNRIFNQLNIIYNGEKLTQQI